MDDLHAARRGESCGDGNASPVRGRALGDAGSTAGRRRPRPSPSRHAPYSALARGGGVGGLSVIPPRPDSCLIRLPRPPGERGVPVMDCSLPYEQLRERPGGVVGVPGSDTDGVPREADEEKSPARSEGCLMRGARGDALGLALARGGLSGSATGPLGFSISMAGTRGWGWGWGWVYLYLFHACALSRSWLMYPIRLRDTV